MFLIFHLNNPIFFILRVGSYAMCVLLLNDTILSMSDRWASFLLVQFCWVWSNKCVLYDFHLCYFLCFFYCKLMLLNKFIVAFFLVSHNILEIKTLTQNFATRWCCKWFHCVVHDHFAIPKHLFYDYSSFCLEMIVVATDFISHIGCVYACVYM